MLFVINRGFLLPIQLNCPNCGQEVIVPNEAINRRARCTSCQTTYAIREALHPPVSQQTSTPESHAVDSMTRGEKRLLGFGLGVPALLFLMSLTYWFGIRDTWETDNYSAIATRCETVLRATRAADDQAASQAYKNLVIFLGNRTIESDQLTSKLKSVELAIDPINERLERERQAAATQSASVLARPRSVENTRAYRNVADTLGDVVTDVHRRGY